MTDEKNPGDDEKDLRDDTQLSDVPVEQTREDNRGFEPITPDGVDPGTPAIPDPKDSQNPPPRRL